MIPQDILSPTPSQVGLKGRDERILRHVTRYRLTTLDVVHHLFFEPEGKCKETARTVVRRLRKHEPEKGRPALLMRTTLVGRQPCYHLTPLAARMLGVPSAPTALIGTHARPIAYGVLLFCCLSDEPRRCESRAAMQDLYPEIAPCFRPGQNFFLRTDQAGVERFGQIYVDLGAEARPFIRKVLKAYRRHCKHPEFLSKHDEHFSFAIVTHSKSKRDALIRAARDLGVKVPITIAVRPLLADVVMGIQRKPRNKRDSSGGQ